MKLYELTGAYLDLVDRLETMELDPQTIADTIEGSAEMANIEHKAFAIVHMTKNWESDIPAIDAEIKRLTDKKKSIENRVKSVKTYLQGHMEAANIDKLKCGTFTIALQNNPPAVQIDDEKSIPSAYITVVPVSYVPDKKRISEALKSGEEVPGCRLTNGRSLRIR